MQTGQIFERGKSWVIKFYETVLVDGQPVRRRVLKRLAAKGLDYPDKKSVESLAAEMLEPVNKQVAPASTEALVSFLEFVYLPACKKELRPSTAAGYEDMLRLVKPHLHGLRVREVEPRHMDKLLRDVAATPTKSGQMRAHTTLTNCRNFLSGAFRYAIREALYSKHNPVREIRLPKGLKRMEDTYAYSFAEVQAMLKKLQEPARTVVMAAAFSGFRHSELRGLRWEDYTGATIKVVRSVWGKHVGETKTEGSRAEVDVIAPLRKALNAHKKRYPSASGYIFEGGTGQPLVLANLARRTIRPALEKAKLEWHGWHAFRRGLATNLHELGVDDLTIQRICRHDDVATTQRHYVKTRDAGRKAAMQKLEKAIARSK
jgi:integrase